MACESCERRQLDCDANRPRCSRCKQSHIKCTYGPQQVSFEFRDETEKARDLSSRTKRRKISVDRDRATADITEQANCENSVNSRELSVLDETWAGIFSQDLINSASWEDGFYNPFDFPNIESSQELLYSGSSLPDFSDPNIEAAENSEPCLVRDTTCQPPQPPYPIEVNLESRPQKDKRPQKVSEHVLNQHYARNLTARYSSRHPGWNFYMHFYNRFTAAHPLVLSSIYAWTSAHLFYSKTLGSLDTAFLYHQQCLDQISSQHEIQTPEAWNAESEDHLAAAISKLSKNSLDAVIVAFYFLASFDLMASQARELRKILRLVTLLIKTRGCTSDVGGIFLRVSTWFCFLDARESAFGQGTCPILTAIGGEDGIVQAMQASRHFLQEEYSILYPAEELQKDEVHAPLLATILRLVATFSDISKHYEGSNNKVRDEIRERLNSYAENVNATRESFALEHNVASTFYILSALYHAVEIYYSRAFLHHLPLYSSNDHAVEIIRITERLYKSFDLAESDPPRTKSWPIPLVMAAIEARDSIYRNWALRKIKDTRHAGDLYSNSCVFVERVQRAEEAAGSRVPLGDIMEGVNKEFVI